MKTTIKDLPGLLITKDGGVVTPSSDITDVIVAATAIVHNSDLEEKSYSNALEVLKIAELRNISVVLEKIHQRLQLIDPGSVPSNSAGSAKSQTANT